jgi:hypothetical protein
LRGVPRRRRPRSGWLRWLRYELWCAASVKLGKSGAWRDGIQDMHASLIPVDCASAGCNYTCLIRAACLQDPSHMESVSVHVFVLCLGLPPGARSAYICRSWCEGPGAQPAHWTGLWPLAHSSYRLRCRHGQTRLPDRTSLLVYGTPSGWK